MGMKGRYPRKVLVVLQSVKECEDVLKKGQMTELANDVFLSRDRTFNQRQEARLFRAEKEKEEREGSGATRGRGRGRGRGPGRPRINATLESDEQTDPKVPQESSHQMVTRSRGAQNTADQGHT